MKTQQTAPFQMTLGNASPRLRPDDDRPPLPEGWVWTTLGEIAELVGGGTPSRQVPEYFNGDIVWLTPTQIPKSKITVISDSEERITQEGLRKSSARLLPINTVLMTSRASIGYVAIAGTELATNQGFASFIPKEGIYNFYLAYWLSANSDSFIQIATGTTFKEISKSTLRPIPIPLAPLPEQHRIVAAIETQFTRLDAAVAALERAKANLARYKASVLKAACEGRLVPTEAALYPGRCDCWGEATPHASTIAQMRGNACRGEATPQASTNAKMCGDAETPDREEPGGGCLAPTDTDAAPPAGVTPSTSAATQIPATDAGGIVDAQMRDNACRGEATPQASPHAKMRGDAKALGQEEPGGGCLAPTDMDAVDAAYEPADVLLRRILAERRARWMADNPGKRYIEPAAPDTSGLPDLPEGWVYILIAPLLSTQRAGMKTGPFGSLLKKHEHQSSGVPVWGIENIGPQEFVPGNKIFITPVKAAQLSQYDIQPQDIIISRSGTVGEVCVVPDGLGDSRFSTNLMRIVLEPGGMLPRFFRFLFNGSPFVLDQVSELCSGSTRDFLNQKILNSIVFPLPPLAEQHRIVAEVERRLSVVAEVEASIDANLARAARLRQAILREAFAGRLVPRGNGDVGVDA